MPALAGFTSDDHLLLIISAPGLDYPQPTLPNVVFTGPMLLPPDNAPLPKEVADWLDGVPDGKPVVYMSFGTVAWLTPDLVRDTAARLAAKADRFYTVWALRKDQQEGLPSPLPASLVVHDWIPTPTVLGHPKVKAFISHCGGNSVNEAMSLGIPIVGVPLFTDQGAIAQRIADAKAGLRTSWPGLDTDAVVKVLDDPSFARTARSIAALFRMAGGLKRAADWVELAADGGMAPLVPARSRMASWRANYWDAKAVTIAGAALALWVALRVACGVLRLCCGVGRRHAPAVPKKRGRKAD
eukprot:NODE_510_length_1407_cov_86.696613_g387_i0.p1 GENE.NODE_510_length_1407_cov_86.696613_g387_i0~~NODE_510_length_1407_cov_86.696613_g387_i0.p1  ORF type:complete len:298 (+),score=87.03 NODE_510_length_1407_cov_86.696613_g387_i0:381-1274(+)